MSSTSSSSTPSENPSTSSATSCYVRSVTDNISLHQLAQVRTAHGGDKKILCDPNYEIVETLGEGGFGTVYLGRRKEEKLLRAIKVAKSFSSSQSASSSSLRTELETLMLLPCHPNICQIVDFSEFDGGAQYQIVMEYCEGGSIASYFQNPGSNTKLSENTVQRLAREIVVALGVLHSVFRIVHKDLKLDNLLLTSTDIETAHVKICDFGLSTRCGKSILGGTPSFVAPEGYKEQNFTSQTDLWALGCCLCMMLSGEKPWIHKIVDPEARQNLEQMRRVVLSSRSLTQQQNLNDINNNNNNHNNNSSSNLMHHSSSSSSHHHPQIPEDVSENGKNFLKQLFRNAECRGNAEYLLYHPWLRTTSTTSSNSTDQDATVELCEQLVQKIQDHPEVARNWSFLGRLMTKDEQISLCLKNQQEAKQFTRQECFYQSCLLEPNDFLWWWLLGMDVGKIFLEASSFDFKPFKFSTKPFAASSTFLSSSSTQQQQQKQIEEENDFEEIDQQYCFLKCIQLRPYFAESYLRLRYCLKEPETEVKLLDGRVYAKLQLCLEALKLSPDDALYWKELFDFLRQCYREHERPKVEILGEVYDFSDLSDEKKLLAKAIELDRSDAMFWYDLYSLLDEELGFDGDDDDDCCYYDDYVGDGVAAANPESEFFAMVGGVKITKRDCLINCVALEAIEPKYWKDLANVLQVGEKVELTEGNFVGKLDCLVNSHSMLLETKQKPDAELCRRIGRLMLEECRYVVVCDVFGTILELTVTDCLSMAVENDLEGSESWFDLYRALERLGKETVTLCVSSMLPSSSDFYCSKLPDDATLLLDGRAVSSSRALHSLPSSAFAAASVSNDHDDDDHDDDELPTTTTTTTTTDELKSKQEHEINFSKLDCLLRAVELGEENVQYLLELICYLEGSSWNETSMQNDDGDGDSVASASATSAAIISSISSSSSTTNVVRLNGNEYSLQALRRKFCSMCQNFFAQVEKVHHISIVGDDWKNHFFYCKEGHVLVPIDEDFVDECWVCDYCQRDGDDGMGSLRCYQCDFDCCPNCWLKFLEETNQKWKMELKQSKKPKKKKKT